MKLLIGLLALVLAFTACGHVNLKPGVKKPATTTAPKNEQTITAPAPELQAGQTNQPLTAAKITIVIPPDIASGNGITGASYLFTITTQGIPDAATYAWLVDEKPSGNGNQVTLTFNETKMYPIRVVATWTDAAGATQTADNALYANIQSKPRLILNAPDGVRGAVGQTYHFSATSQGIPPQALYTYYADGSTFGTGDAIYIATFVPRESKNGPYTIKVTAQWTTLAGTQTVSDTLEFTVIESRPKLTLSIPSGTAGPNAWYRFVVQPSNILVGAMYTWYVNGRDVHAGGVDEFTADTQPGFFTGGRQYTVSVVADWTNGAGTMFTARADGVFYCYR